MAKDKVVVDLSSQADMDFKPTLHDVHRVLDEEIVGEYESRLSLFTNWILANQNVLMSGPRSSGKTWITDRVLAFLGDSVFTMSSGSDKSSWYQMEAVNRSTHVRILELNKCPKDFLETLKDWGEGKDSVYKTTVVDGGERRVRSFKLPRKPFVFCLADEDEMKVGEQLMSRLTRIRTDSSLSQNTAVLKWQAELAKEPANRKRVDEEFKTKLIYHVRTLPAYESFDYKHPAADLFVDVIPKMFTDCRRDFQKYLANTYGITRFYWKERIISQQPGKKRMLFVTPQDMYLNHEVYGQTLVESALKCSAVEREMIKIVEHLDVATKNMVQSKLREMGISISIHMVAKHLNALADLGYIVKSKEGVQVVYKSAEHEAFTFQINWDKVIDRCVSEVKRLYPNIADQYIQKYCEKPMVIHPFTGKVIDLRKQESAPKQYSRDTLAYYQKPAVQEVVVE